MSRFGPANSNWRGGLHSDYQSLEERAMWQQAQAKDLLNRILTTPCDGRGELPFSAEEQQWAMRVCRERPDWAEETLRNLGFGPKGG